MSLQLAEQVADSVLYEGYVLYPYRASAAKNRLRWQVGLVVPRGYAEATGSDPWWMQTEVLAEADDIATLTVRVRCLQVQERRIEKPLDAAGTAWIPIDHLTVDGRSLVTWDEAVVREFVRDGLRIDGSPWSRCYSWTLDGAEDVETIRTPSGSLAARIVRCRRPVASTVHIAAERHGGLTRIRVRVDNISACPARELGERDAALRQSLAGTHTLLGIEKGAFVSLLEPPAEAASAAAACSNERTWPVLIGAAGSRDVMLSSPIILYDYPAVAPESPGDFCDATEIDEMLMLRVQTLTDAEKREGRATDRRAAHIIDRAESASAATMGNLHGAIRHFADAPTFPVHDWESFVNPPGDEPPEAAYVDVGSVRIANGSRVRLAPSHRADSLDICLKGRMATVSGVYRTLEGQAYIAVTLDDDPFGASGARFRRALFFHPDEVVPE